MSLVLVLVAAPHRAAGSDLVADVVSMLEAGVSERVILEWLPTALDELSAQELIALDEAGASDALILRLLELSREPDTRAADASSSPVPAGAAAVASRGAEAQGRVAAEGASETVLVEFEVDYSARFEDPEPSWDLFVYLDGIPLTYLAPRSLLDSDGLHFTRELAAGRHVLRLTQERHEERRGRWEHSSRIAPDAFEFDLTAGTPAAVSIDFRQRLSDYNDPISFVATQGARVVDTGRVGGDAERWAPVCEDVLASVPPGEKPGRAERARLEECVDWSRMWSRLEVPSRQEILEAMARFDFRPVPKGS